MNKWSCIDFRRGGVGRGGGYGRDGGRRRTMCPVCCLQPSDDVAVLMPTRSPSAPTLPSSQRPSPGFTFFFTRSHPHSHPSSLPPTPSALLGLSCLSELSSNKSAFIGSFYNASTARIVKTQQQWLCGLWITNVTPGAKTIHENNPRKTRLWLFTYKVTHISPCDIQPHTYMWMYSAVIVRIQIHTCSQETDSNLP